MKVKIQLFAGFKIECFDGSQEEAVSQFDVSSVGKELQNLLQVLIVNRKQHMTRDMLVDLLYPDRKDPAGCLKYAIFRLRKVIKDSLDVNLVVTDSAGYTLNADFEYEIDIELFETVHSLYRNAASEEERVRLSDQMLAIYQGYFYQTPSMMMWTLEQKEYFQNRFGSLIASQAEEYCGREEYHAAIEICQKAIAIDDFNEDVSYHFLKALVGDKQYLRAMNYYKGLTKSYMNTFGEPPSQKLRKMFHLITTESTGERLTADNVQQIMAKETVMEGAFFCNYEVFSHLFQLESRRLMRDNTSEVRILMLMEIVNAVNEEALNVWMEHLKESIRKTLRQGDAFTRANKHQFLMMVVCHELDNATIIEERIKKNFFDRRRYERAQISTEITEILPLDKI